MLALVMTITGQPLGDQASTQRMLSLALLWCKSATLRAPALEMGLSPLSNIKKLSQQVHVKDTGQQKEPEGMVGDVWWWPEPEASTKTWSIDLAIHGVTKDYSTAVQPCSTSDELPAEHFPGHSKCSAKQFTIKKWTPLKKKKMHMRAINVLKRRRCSTRWGH